MGIIWGQAKCFVDSFVKVEFNAVERLVDHDCFSSLRMPQYQRQSEGRSCLHLQTHWVEEHEAELIYLGFG
jgi:hypothetical protein